MEFIEQMAKHSVISVGSKYHSGDEMQFFILCIPKQQNLYILVHHIGINRILMDIELGSRHGSVVSEILTCTKTPILRVLTD